MQWSGCLRPRDGRVYLQQGLRHRQLRCSVSWCYNRPLHWAGHSNLLSLLSQVAFADRIVLNKIDRVGPGPLWLLEKTLHMCAHDLSHQAPDRHLRVWGQDRVGWLHRS